MPWPETRLTELLGIRYPIVQAPMAGASTPELVAAVSNAGGLGSLAGGGLGPDDLRGAIGAVRALTDERFAVNLLLPPATDEEGLERARRMADELADLRRRYGLPEPELRLPDVDGMFAAQLSVVAEERVPAFSFAFGIPEGLASLREAGTRVLGTATTPAEARALVAAGVDAVVAQGAEAGGHRGTFLGSFRQSLVGGLALLPRVADAVAVPVVAAGAVMDGRGVAAALALGADGVQLGTAFLAADESGAPEAYKRALADADAASVITAAYTGRPARTLATPLLERLEQSGVPAAPYVLASPMIRQIHTAAGERGEAEAMVLFAGQGAPLARRLPAAALVEALVAETADVLARLAR